MKLKLLIERGLNDSVWKIISPEEARDRNMFGPVFHGTTGKNIETIKKEGLKFWEEEALTGNTRLGFPTGKAYGIVPVPVHFLGYGIYFTESLTRAKRYGENSTKNIIECYIDAPRVCTINWGSENTMSKWWVENGYDGNLAKTDRVSATKKLTETLKSKYDIVYYKGKGLHSLLDGNQIVVFDPSRIYVVNPELSKVRIIDPIKAHIKRYIENEENPVRKKEMEDYLPKFIEYMKTSRKEVMESIGKIFNVERFERGSYPVVKINKKNIILNRDEWENVK